MFTPLPTHSNLAGVFPPHKDFDEVEIYPHAMQRPGGTGQSDRVLSLFLPPSTRNNVGLFTFLFSMPFFYIGLPVQTVLKELCRLANIPFDDQSKFTAIDQAAMTRKGGTNFQMPSFKDPFVAAAAKAFDTFTVNSPDKTLFSVAPGPLKDTRKALEKDGWLVT